MPLSHADRARAFALPGVAHVGDRTGLSRTLIGEGDQFQRSAHAQRCSEPQSPPSRRSNRVSEKWSQGQNCRTQTLPTGYSA
ncbi:hypothetical protein Mvan_4828 [Mycolicibacterium vanbaalenii PYR-1]|uniref:Uncharacterized protein n=1 Tax=Mycolicibacterium vanbaalenii (strain DSM 7251 / JCM 13017 / BCRC 16820 / KCTC 9966 / NRRL B-24157 / PYR-1) TaxID=350058 RepID=A1TEK1_MYCVP|nr:hypothetical protein Mvan_4828 [Mycolicibacterium vanbaalenii PYR-1]